MGFHAKLHALSRLCVVVAQTEEAVDGIDEDFSLVVLVVTGVIALELELCDGLVDCSAACCPSGVVGFAHTRVGMHRR